MPRGGIAGVTIAALLTLAPGAEATTFTVDTKRDLLDANQVDGMCAADNGKCSVRAATMAANGNPGLDEIVIPAGTYELTQPIDDVESSLEGDLNTDEAVTIDGAGPQETIIKQTVGDRVIRSDATPAGLVPGLLMTDLTVTGGRLPKAGNKLGAGILVEDFVLGIDNVTVRDNKITRRSANSFGGGIAVTAPATALIQASKITGNAVDIRASETTGAIGGGIYIDGDGSPGSNVSTITDTEVKNNVARVDGGDGGTGGGVFARGPTVITRSEISGNQADEGGGLTLTQLLDSAEILDTTISRNKAVRGAGVHISTLDPASFENTTISENTLLRGRRPGGGALHSTSGDIAMEHVTIAENHSGRKKAVLLKPFDPGGVELEIDGSVIAGPHRDCKFGEASVDRDLNVFGDASCTPAGLSTNIVANPELKSLAQNPGAFPAFNFYGETHMPKSGSPVVGFVSVGCPPPAQDQLGFDRIGPCDAGAVERPGV